MSWKPTKVYTQTEFKLLIGENPMHLKAFRESLPPRPGHPGFIGPMPKETTPIVGAICYDEHGQAYINW